jgi:adenylyltransferase/sulfurtransferase
MSETDWKLLNRRRSCNLLSKDEMQEGKIPTTPTISAIIAGIQCQEMVKLLHGMETIAGKGFVYNGISADSYLIEYQRNEECYSHDTAERIYSLKNRTNEVKIRDLLEIARQRLGEDAVFELGRDILESMHCPACGNTEKFYISLGKAKNSMAACPECGQKREVNTIFTIRGDEDFCEKTFSKIGVPPFDIVWARNAEHLIGFEFSSDADMVLGPLMESEKNEL